MNDAQNLYIPNVQLASTHTFYALGQRKVDIDSSGNLLVGKSAAGSIATVPGCELLSSGLARMSRNNGPAGQFNLNGDDGDVVTISKDGTPVGSIGAELGNVFLNSASTGFLSTAGTRRYKWDSLQFYPNVNDNNNLGTTNFKWKDLYLSGGVYLGGTGAANKLDDYEEGTFTPTITSATGTLTTVSAAGAYTKVGRLVTASVDITVTTNGTGAGFISTTLPFTASSIVQFGTGREVSAVGFTITMQTSGASALILKAANDGYPSGDGYRLKGSVTYSV